MRTHRHSSAIAIAGLVLAAVGAYGFAPRAACAAEPEFVVRIQAHKFVPAEVRVPAGVKIRLVVDNQDDGPEEFDSHALNREKHIPPRTRVTLFVGPLEPGRYPFEGESHGPAGGMAQGVLVAK